MAKRKPKFWNDFEKFLGSSYPKFIKNILFDSGFDNKSSLLLIDEKSIKDIEEYVSKNRYLLKKKSYEKNLEKNTDKVEFFIGHKVLLTNIPKYVKQFEEESARKLEEKNKSKKEIKENSDPSVLKNILIDKLQNYSKATKLNFEMLQVPHIEPNFLADFDAETGEESHDANPIEIDPLENRLSNFDMLHESQQNDTENDRDNQSSIDEMNIMDSVPIISDLDSQIESACVIHKTTLGTASTLASPAVVIDSFASASATVLTSTSPNSPPSLEFAHTMSTGRKCWIIE